MQEQKVDILEYVKQFMEVDPDGFRKQFWRFIDWMKNPPPPDLQVVRTPEDEIVAERNRYLRQLYMSKEGA